jgi:metal iron transporter
MGGHGLNTMLVASQVVLSVVLPTVIFPLVYLCSKKEVMTVKGPEVESASVSSASASDPTRTTMPEVQEEIRPTEVVDGRREKCYTSPKWVTVLGYLLTFVVLLANVYVFVQLGLGN